MIAGVGTAWLVTTYEFPGRGIMLWLLPLPLAFPTYIVAYVYADLLDGLGPVQSSLRALFGWQSAADYWFPNIRSLGGAVLVMGFVLYPYVYLAARAMFQTQSACLVRDGAGPRRDPVAARASTSHCRWHGPPSRPAWRSRCWKRSTTSAPANISACRP